MPEVHRANLAHHDHNDHSFIPTEKKPQVRSNTLVSFRSASLGLAGQFPVGINNLMDTIPETGTFGDAGLVVGRTCTEPFTGTTVTVDSRTETTLTVTVAGCRRPSAAALASRPQRWYFGGPLRGQ
jgi:hypothetical protein